jgi:hypothetical protein
MSIFVDFFLIPILYNVNITVMRLSEKAGTVPKDWCRTVKKLFDQKTTNAIEL